jgi:hypothetical protein
MAEKMVEKIVCYLRNSLSTEYRYNKILIDCVFGNNKFVVPSTRTIDLGFASVNSQCLGDNKLANFWNFKILNFWTFFFFNFRIFSEHFEILWKLKFLKFWNFLVNRRWSPSVPNKQNFNPNGRKTSKKFLPVIPCDVDMIRVSDSICCPDSRL